MEVSACNAILTPSPAQRIAELIRKKQRQRVAGNLAMEKRLAQGDQVRDKKGKVVAGVPQPTLPSVAWSGDDDDMQLKSDMGSYRAAPTRSKSDMSLDTAASDWRGEKHGYEYAQAMNDGTYPTMREWLLVRRIGDLIRTTDHSSVGLRSNPRLPDLPACNGRIPLDG